jgi:hypothetical protein
MKGCPLEYGRREVRPIRALGSTRRQPEVAQAVMPTTANDQVVVDRKCEAGRVPWFPQFRHESRLFN